MTPAQSAFIDTARDCYDGGAIKAEIDIDQLTYIADRIATFVATAHPMFDRLDIARDVKAGHSITRSRYMPDIIARMIAESLANELLSAEAGAVLMEMVRGQYE